ncbi:MAG TPA: winged helix-turn-helix transcriptional regulator [Ktedonobacterales bacterium]|nr:winged helix-turn-helix transcriptional regulator [Ktedonobacterales bacterium]
MPRPKKAVLCPLGGVGVGGKWMLWIWYHLLGGTKRIGELQRLIPQASRQMLTQQLRELERIGVIRRKVYAQLPPKVEYSLTDVGRQSEPMLRQFFAWGQWCSATIGLDFDDWLMILSGRWMIWIWYHLFSGPKRFSELRQLLPSANHQILTSRLRELERMGIIRRMASTQGAPKVEYTLTEVGRRSEPALQATYQWGRWICDQLGVEFEWPLSDEEVVGQLCSLPEALTSMTTWRESLESVGMPA